MISEKSQRKDCPIGNIQKQKPERVALSTWVLTEAKTKKFKFDNFVVSEEKVQLIPEMLLSV